MVIKKVQVRAAAALTGSNQTTNAVDCRGARNVVFEVKATDATTLSAASIEVSNDGTNWVVLNAGLAPANGKASATYDAPITIALNAGPAQALLSPLTANNLGPAFIIDAQARLKVSTAGTVAGFEVWAYVYYDGDQPKMVSGEKAGVGPAL